MRIAKLQQNGRTAIVTYSEAAQKYTVDCWAGKSRVQQVFEEQELAGTAAQEFVDGESTTVDSGPVELTPASGLVEDEQD